VRSSYCVENAIGALTIYYNNITYTFQHRSWYVLHVRILLLYTHQHAHTHTYTYQTTKLYLTRLWPVYKKNVGRTQYRITLTDDILLLYCIIFLVCVPFRPLVFWLNTPALTFSRAKTPNRRRKKSVVEFTAFKYAFLMGDLDICLFGWYQQKVIIFRILHLLPISLITIYCLKSLRGNADVILIIWSSILLIL